MKRLSQSIITCALVVLVCPSPASGQRGFTIEQILSAPTPSNLVSARQADRIAWIENERGMRNVYTAAAPDFRPVRLTSNLEDDGNDLSSLRISDDGSLVVFVRGHSANADGWIANPTSDPAGSERAVWAVTTSGGEPWKVTETTASPLLSPDGSTVLLARGGQIFRVAVAPSGDARETGNRVEPLFRSHGTNRSPRWSPDGTKVAFVSDRVDHGYIGIYDVEDPKITYLAPGVDRDTSPTWSPDGARIAFIRRPGALYPVESSRPIDEKLTRPVFRGGHVLTFWVADVATGEGHEFWRNPLDEEAFASITSIQWADDHVVFQAERGNWNHYYSVPISGTSPTPFELTPGEGVGEQMRFSRDGALLYYSSNVGDIDRRHIWQVPTRGGTSTRLTEGTGIETNPTPLASGERLALLSAGAKQPQSVGLVSAPGGGVEIIAPELGEDFPLDEQVVPEAVVLTAEDGVRFHAQLFVPGDKQPGERGPAIVFAHGGPRSQMYLGYHTSRFYHMAYAINQYFASQGYVVLSVNYRRGTGYGREFRTADNAGSSGASEYRDIYAAGRYLQDRPDVDPGRIGMWGLSYGGILTSTALARNSDVFAAGVDIAGLHHWAGENPLSGRPFERPYDPASVAYSSSAVADVDGAMSPILLIHGDDDRNVEFSQTTHLVQLLRAHGAYYELIVFPDDVHVFLVFDRWLKTFNAADDFFGRFLKEPAGKH